MIDYILPYHSCLYMHMASVTMSEWMLVAMCMHTYIIIKTRTIIMLIWINTGSMCTCADATRHDKCVTMSECTMSQCVLHACVLRVLHMQSLYTHTM